MSPDGSSFYFRKQPKPRPYAVTWQSKQEVLSLASLATCQGLRKWFLEKEQQLIDRKGPEITVKLGNNDTQADFGNYFSLFYPLVFLVLFWYFLRLLVLLSYFLILNELLCCCSIYLFLLHSVILFYFMFFPPVHYCVITVYTYAVFLLVDCVF